MSNLTLIELFVRLPPLILTRLLFLAKVYVTSESSTFNILVLGDKGSGKSALIEAIKGYDNKDISHLDILSYTPTEEVASTIITTSLPGFSVFEDVGGYSG
ncbi:hypothetical protein BGX21_006606 [Mortierella sp. AD011]|nr:hypothetical protein BGX20_006634 [Mortierella sp. AD010]KAF9399231.1 hypothetical protein BGX21_006606 [Mortierella sp. AD011]